MNQIKFRVAPIRLIIKFYLLAVVICYSTACTTTPTTKFSKEQQELEQDFQRRKNVEKKIYIPKIKDPNSIFGSLHHKLPFSSEITEGTTLEIFADSTKLCMKGDSCWLEYITNAIIHTRQKNGMVRKDTFAAVETTDVVGVR